MQFRLPLAGKWCRLLGGRESIEEMLLIRSVKRLIILSEKAEDCVLESECDADVNR